MAYFVQIKNLYEYHDDASALHLLIFSQPYKQIDVTVLHKVHDENLG